MDIQVNNQIEIQNVAKHIAELINKHLLLDRKVLWLVPGGSAIQIAALASKLITRGNITVALTDERFGDVGHKDSNLKQLIDAGFEISIFPVLSGKAIKETVNNFGDFLEKILKEADYKIGLFGIGKDGHTAGILPHTEAVFADTLTYGYNTDTFQRITITPRAIEKLDEVVIFAVGEDKYPALQNLKKNLNINEEPAQIFKKVPSVTLFTDYNFD